MVFNEVKNFLFLLPDDIDKTFVKYFVKFVNFILNKWSFHRMKAGDNTVVLTNNYFKLSDLCLELLIALKDR